MRKADIFTEILSPEDLKQYDNHIMAGMRYAIMAPDDPTFQERISTEITSAMRIALKYRDKDARVVPTVIDIVTPFVTAPSIKASGGHRETFQLAEELGIKLNTTDTVGN